MQELILIFRDWVLKVYTHNLHKNEILAGRVHFQPAAVTNIPLWKKLRVGVNVGTDLINMPNMKMTMGIIFRMFMINFPRIKNSYLDTAIMTELPIMLI